MSLTALVTAGCWTDLAMLHRPNNIDLYGSIADRDHRLATGVNRADGRLRSFPRREGDAVFCGDCDGAGYVVRAKRSAYTEQIDKCSRCGGEGLEPK